ncbi:hypothetical protein ACKWRH_01385 [Bradyrhizobium sp. Pa8]|uniref:hypothetical protein n=1 Tax=Bradyrhizobium sp. Pa8 TaxID=3386552 RepID=UPI00403FA758
MSAARLRICLLIANLGAVVGIASTFIWALRGVHRFPIEAAIYAAILLVLLLSNAAYIWLQRRSP